MASVGLCPHGGRGLCISLPKTGTIFTARLMTQHPYSAGPIHSANLVDVGLLANPRAARSPLLAPHRRSVVVSSVVDGETNQ